MKEEMACVVLSLNNQSTLVDAVRSLLAQDSPVEIVVVNSGGGQSETTLKDAGISVTVIDHPVRLFAGGARNLGIAASSAPYVAFLAADCTAEPSWVSNRLRRHRAGALAVSSAITNPSRNNSYAWASYILGYARRMPWTLPDVSLRYGVSYARALLERMGPFRGDLPTGEDTDFNGRLNDLVPIQWAPEVRTAHRHPTALSRLLRDQFARGGQRVLAHQNLRGKPHRLGTVVNAMIDMLRCTRWAWSGAGAEDKGQILRALPWLIPGAGSYILGALLKPLDRRRAPCGTTIPDQPGGASAAGSRIFALLTFHNEMRYLPGFFANVSQHVDGIIALDDASTDGSGDFVRRQSKVLQFLSNPPSDPHQWDGGLNQRRLIEAALAHSPAWLIAIDADERLEIDFRLRADKELERAAREGHRAYSVRLRELWDRPDTYRADGVWDKKRHARFFEARQDHVFNDRLRHGQWAPANSREMGEFPPADLVFYHLRMIDPAERTRRYQRFCRLDPDRFWQAIGYEHLIDEKGLRCKPLPRGRGYLPLHTESSAAQQHVAAPLTLAK